MKERSGGEMKGEDTRTDRRATEKGWEEEEGTR